MPHGTWPLARDIEFRTTEVGNPRSNGFVERFNRTLLDEFFRSYFRKKLYDIVKSLQTDLNEWLNHYNYVRPHCGYRRMGRRPVKTIDLGKKRRKELTKAAA